MSRQYVEARTRDNVHGVFPDENTPVTTLPAPGTDVVARDGANGGPLDLTLPSVLTNPEVAPNNHTFNFTLEGQDVPGTSVNINPVMAAAVNLGAVTLVAGASMPANPSRYLFGDQAVIAQMVEAVVANQPFFLASYEDEYAPLDNLKVVPEIPGGDIQLLNSVTPFVIDGPSADFSTRTVKLSGTTVITLGTLLVNQDTVDHTITVTLVDPVNGNLVLANAIVVPTGSMLHLDAVLPATVNLKEGQSLQFETATATTTTDPYVWAFWTDRV